MTPDEGDELIRLCRELRRVTEERDILERSGRYLHEGTAVRCRFVQDHKCQFRIRVMRAHSVSARPKRRVVVTTDSKHNLPVGPNLLDRQFISAGPNLVWASDITYIRTLEWWLYLSVVIDLHSRMVVGWSMSERLSAPLVLDALSMAISRRDPAAGLTHHSDRGSQYAGGEYQRMLASAGMICSISRRGDCYDNAVAESFFDSLKTEQVYRQQYLTREEARWDIFRYIEVFYNRCRLHSTSGYLSPVQFEQQAATAA